MSDRAQDAAAVWPLVRHLAVACRLVKPSPSLPPALSIHSLPLPSHSLSCSPSVSLTASCSAWPSSRAAASLAPPLPRHHRASQHRLRVCFRCLDASPTLAAPPLAAAASSRWPAKSLLRLGEQDREKDFVLEFEKREGSFCEVVTHVNSAQEDLFAVV